MTVKLKKEGWLPLFEQMRSPQGFLSRMFTIKPGGTYNGNKVAIDIVRTDEDVAVAIKKCSGSNLNTIDQFTTKEFEPPAYGEAFHINACDLVNRMAGVNPYEAAYRANAAQVVAKAMKGFALIFDKIARAVELQASQILQTGKLNLINKEGTVTYELDFKPKATHFPTVGTAWDQAGADPLGDLAALAKVIRADGKVQPNRLLFGDKALSDFLKNADVQDALDNRRIDVGAIAPEFDNSGATFYGYVWVGTYRFEIWAYPETYKHPQTGDATDYIDPLSVVMLSKDTRLDMASAIVPSLIPVDSRVSGLLPGRLSSRAGSFDILPNIYPSTDGKQIIGDLESRPLLIPVQIDGFGCLTVG